MDRMDGAHLLGKGRARSGMAQLIRGMACEWGAGAPERTCAIASTAACIGSISATIRWVGCNQPGGALHLVQVGKGGPEQRASVEPEGRARKIQGR